MLGLASSGASEIEQHMEASMPLSTVHSHLRAIYRKLAVNSRAALASHVSLVNEAAQARRET
jgi:DNA-binding CsgD family transcriptional regulator